MRLMLAAVAWALAAAHGATAAEAPSEAGIYPPRFEIHPIQSLTLTDEQFLSGQADGARAVTVAGVLRIAKAGKDRLPTVVLMHGSGGIGGNIAFWERALNARGISTFAIDGFTGRGLTVVNTNQALLSRTNLILDIYRALGVLATHPRVDPARVAVMGFSRGGQATLYASLARFDRAWNRSGLTPAIYLPVYPDCSITFQTDTDLVARPVRILAAGADDYNPAGPCLAYAARLREAGRDAAITVYPGGQHVFDNPVGPREPTVSPGAQTVRNCSIREEPEGRLVNARTGEPFSYSDPCVETGPHIGSDDALREAALAAVAEELKSAFRP
ncbi:dienelactone hydrolase family protein [Methylobacterium oxalidis]|uniref:dienelactone hydrolase family protein n=1 Tax=Methylobacterium oxalidis TaxID=944322 RepID=UPI00331480D9